MSKSSQSVLSFFKLIGVGVMAIFGSLRFCDDGARLLKNSDNVYDGARYLDKANDGRRFMDGAIFTSTDDAVIFKNATNTKYANKYIDNSTVYIESQNSFDWRIAVLKDKMKQKKILKEANKAERSKNVMSSKMNAATTEYLEENFKGLQPLEKMAARQKLSRNTYLKISKLIIKSIELYYDEYEKDKQKLDLSFGEHHPICREFEAAFFLEGDLPAAKESMIPDELKKFDANHPAQKLLAPLKETAFNQNQADAIGEVLGLSLGEISAEEEKIVILENKEDMLQVKGTGNLLLTSPLEYGAQFPYEKESTIVLVGNFSQKELTVLKDLEVKDVINIEDYQP